MERFNGFHIIMNVKIYFSLILITTMQCYARYTQIQFPFPRIPIKINKKINECLNNVNSYCTNTLMNS